MKRRGLTTLELLVALGVTTITGLGVAMVITSVSRGVTDMNCSRSAMQRAATSHVRLQAYTESSRCLIGHDKRGFALWAHDERANDVINVSELRVFWFDKGANEVVTEYVEFPEEMTDEERALADIIVSSAESPFAVMMAQRTLGYTTQAVLADGVETLTITHTQEDPLDAERFRVHIGFDGGSKTQQLLMAVGLTQYQRPL